MSRAIGVALLALLGCQAAPPAPSPELPFPPRRVFQNAYSFMPPDEPGWRVVARNAQQLAFARAGGRPDETFAIQGRVFRLPAYASPEEFVALIRKGLAEQAADPRYTALKHEVTGDAASCARSHFVARDREILVLEVRTRSCAHPKVPSLAVTLVYSHRYRPGDADPGLAEKAERLFSSVEYLE